MTSCRCSSSAPAPAAPASTHTLGLLLVWVMMLQDRTSEPKQGKQGRQQSWSKQLGWSLRHHKQAG
jgi:hypothetical protein